MPHPEQEHALMIEVARLRKERDEALSREARLAAANKALAADVTRCAGIESALAAARRECDLYRKALREISERIDSKKNPQAARARGIASAALAAHGDGEEGKR